MSLQATKIGEPGRWIGVDYGTRRIGLAISDPGGRIASPAGVCNACTDVNRDAHTIIRWSSGRGATGFVVGIPFDPDGGLGPQGAAIESFAAALERLSGMPVHRQDERLTSYQADENMRAAGVPPRRQWKHRDAQAAQVILQAFLDSQV